jgi:hypothetical protein
MPLILRVIIVAALVLAPTSAMADDKSDCISASERAQSLAAQKHFIDARKDFVACARAECPGPIIKDCSEQLARIDASIATIVPIARAGETELRDVRVTMDGAPLLSSLDGHAIAVDPGPHRFVFTNAQGERRMLDAIVAEGTKLDRVEVAFPLPPPPPPVPTRRAPVSALTWILGGVGLAGIGVGTALGIDTFVRRDHVYTTSSLDAFELEQHFVDVAFGVGVVALATAVVLVLTRPRVPITTHVGLGALRVEFP